MLLERQPFWCKVIYLVSLLPSQCRAARALLKLTQAELGERARVAKKTIADFEVEARVPHPRTLAALREALEADGVQIVDSNGGGPGVRLKT